MKKITILISLALTICSGFVYTSRPLSADSSVNSSAPLTNDAVQKEDEAEFYTLQEPTKPFMRWNQKRMH